MNEIFPDLSAEVVIDKSEQLRTPESQKMK
jgi:hypothetical protein